MGFLCVHIIYIFIYILYALYYIYIYVIMKLRYPPSYHHNGFVVTHTRGRIIYIYNIYIIYIYIHIHVFRPSQDSSVWLGLTSREQLMSPECSMNKFRAYISRTPYIYHTYIYIV